MTDDSEGSPSSLLSIIAAYEEYDEEHDEEYNEEYNEYNEYNEEYDGGAGIAQGCSGDRAGVLPPPEKPPPVLPGSPKVRSDMSKGFFRRLFGGGSSAHAKEPEKEVRQAEKEVRSAPRLDVPLTDSEEALSKERLCDSELSKERPALSLRVSVPRKPVQRLNLEPASPLMPKIEGGLTQPIGLGIKAKSPIERSERPVDRLEEEDEDVFHDVDRDDASTLGGSTVDAVVNGSEALRQDMSPVPEVVISEGEVVSSNGKGENGGKGVSPYLNSTSNSNFNSNSNSNLNNLNNLNNFNKLNNLNNSMTSLVEPQRPEAIAQRLYEGTAALAQDEYAAWMGNDGEQQSSVRQAYMALFEFGGRSILAALRLLCDRLYMKGESQQLNRVIEAFSNAWTDKNPAHGFYDSTVVYTVAYALILLNTDIYAADHSVTKKMSKTKFVWNTMETIRNHTANHTANHEAVRSMSAFGHRPDEFESKRSSFNLTGDTMLLVGSCPVPALSREWEMQVEAVLKVFYGSVAKEALKLHLVETPPACIPANIYAPGHGLAPIHSASAAAASPSGRSPSLLSRMRLKKSYENQSRLVDRSSESFRRNSINSTLSFESNFSSLGRHAVGFAGILWNSMIREESPIPSVDDGDLLGEDAFADFARIEAELAKEVELELHGAPWVKEGLLKYRPFVDPNTGKKAKKKEWVQVFAVVQRGQLKMFRFDTKSSSSATSGGVVGGGNWMENANLVDGFHLCHTLAQELPPTKKSKGYNAVWSLTLPQRGLLVFQAGTPEIAREFVHTCNYWAGRLSKEPFEEPVSSVEYGWGIASAASEQATLRTIPKSSSTRNLTHKKSFHQTTHSITTATAATTTATVGGIAATARGVGKLSRSPSLTFHSKYEARYERLERPGDKLAIKEWRPTGHSMIVSDLNEEKQLDSLRAYVATAEDRLEEHNLLRPKLRYAFTPGTPNWARAHSNWERKSQYLLQQVVRYKVYVESLHSGIEAKRASPVVEHIIERQYTDSDDDSSNEEMLTPTAELFDSEQTLHAPQSELAKLGDANLGSFVPQSRCFSET